MTQKTITLSLDSADRVQTFNKDELLQIDAYDSANILLNNAANLVKKINEKRPNNQNWSANPAEQLERIHNAIFIDGKRGTGKTAFMLNLEQMYTNQSDNHTSNGLYFCQPIDPTLLNVKEDFLNIIIGQIHAEVECKNQQLDDNYYQTLSKAAEALESESTAKNHVGIDKILSFKSSLGLERSLFDYFTAATKALESNAIVLLIDDVDMSLDMAFNVLEVIRKYLACPYIIPIVSGDKEQYSRLIYKHFVVKLAVNGERPTKSEKNSAKDLAHRYMQKLFPEHGQIRLKTFTDLINQHHIIIQFEQYHLNFNTLYKRLEQIIWAGATNSETFWTDFTPVITREAIQLNNKLAGLEYHIKQTLFNQPQSLDNLYDNADLLKELMDYFYANHKSLLAHVIETTLNILTIRQSNHWHPLRHIGIFDIKKQQLCSPDQKSQFKTNTIAQLSKPLFSKTEREAQHHSLLNLPEIAMNYPRVELFTTKLRVKKNALNEFESNDEKLQLSLYTHHDYFNSDSTGHFVFFGKIIEIIISSIIQPIDKDALKKIVKQPPLHSFFHFFPNNPASIDEEDDESDEDTLETEEALVVKYKQLADDITAWRKNMIDYRPSTILIYTMIFKYFENIQLLKGQKFFQHLSFDEIHERVKFITLNACASFEINENGLSKQSIATSESFDSDNIKKHSPAYRNNIAPLLEDKNTLTYCIDKHPIWKIKGMYWLDTNGNYISETDELAYEVPEEWELQNLDCVTTGKEREMVFNMIKRGKFDDKLIIDIVYRIMTHEEMGKYKAFYKDRSTRGNNNFGRFYAVAKAANVAQDLIEWLNSDE